MLNIILGKCKCFSCKCGFC